MNVEWCLSMLINRDKLYCDTYVHINCRFSSYNQERLTADIITETADHKYINKQSLFQLSFCMHRTSLIYIWNKLLKREWLDFLTFVPSCTSFCASRLRQYEQGEIAVAEQKPIGRPSGQLFCFFCGLPTQISDNSAQNLSPSVPGFREWKRNFIAPHSML